VGGLRRASREERSVSGKMLGNEPRSGCGKAMEINQTSRSLGCHGRSVWAVMAELPPELVQTVLVLAEIEIPESVGCRLPARRSVRVPLKDPNAWWARMVKEYAFPERC
jgi:hypothetical protein